MREYWRTQIETAVHTCRALDHRGLITSPLSTGCISRRWTYLDLTNAFFYTYVRACLPTRYVPPIYYIDRLCDMAWGHFADFKIARY
jgi:hypothetical protein